MKIVCLAWGSLVWCPRDLKVAGTWQPDGPELPIEFARTSDGGKGRLTLVVTPGAVCVTTLWSFLDYPTGESARAALRQREGCRLRDAGIWPAVDASRWFCADVIGEWAESHGFDHVIWTALPPKFDHQDGVPPPSAQAAIEYLASRDPKVRQDADGYVRRAPKQVRTLFRAAFEEHFGWRPVEASDAN